MDTVTDLPVILQLSLYGTALALVLAALRRLLKNRLPHALFYYLWLLVLLRLVVPLAVPVPQPVRELPRQLEQVIRQEVPVETPPVQTAPPAAEPMVPPAAAEPVPAPRQLPERGAWLTTMWLTGAALHFLWFALSYLRYTRPIAASCIPVDEEDWTAAVRNRAAVCRSPLVKTPMLLGLFHPRIVLPETLQAAPEALSLILRHELIHLSRRDLWYKWLTVAVTSLHWFNPLMPWLRREISRCGELSCDEALLRTVPAEMRQAYGRTLLSLAAGPLPAAVPATLLCEEKRELKERLVSIVKHRKTTLWMLLFSLLLALMVAGCAAFLGPEKDSGRFAAPLTAEHQEEILAAVGRWGEENVPQHAQAELQVSEGTGDGENNTLFVPHLYDLQTGEIRPVDGVYAGDACLGVVYYMAAKTDDHLAEHHLFYLVQGKPEAVDPAAVLNKELSSYENAWVLNAGWRQQKGNCLFFNAWFVTEEGQLMRCVYNGVTGAIVTKAMEDDRGNGWDMPLSRLPEAMAAAAAAHDQVESDYYMIWNGDFTEIALSMEPSERAGFLSGWSQRRVLDLAAGVVAPLEGEYAPAANYGSLSFLYPSQHTEYLYLVTNATP